MMGHSPNAWVLPGGHLEVHESFEHGICREIVEETGLVINENQPKMFLMYENSKTMIMEPNSSFSLKLQFQNLPKN